MNSKSINIVSKFFSSKEVKALSQLDPRLAAISEYLGSSYEEDQYKALEKLVHSIHERTRQIEERFIDKEFFDKSEGRQLLTNIVRMILRDRRERKINAAATLTVTCFIKSSVSLDEKELFVYVLDNLNPLQISIIEQAVLTIKTRKEPVHRGFGWEKMHKDLEDKGISKYVLLQSIRTLESHGLLNINTATIQEADKTHYVTEFGEKFYEFISSPDTVIKQYYMES